MSLSYILDKPLLGVVCNYIEQYGEKMDKINFEKINIKFSNLINLQLNKPIEKWELQKIILT